jgi:hypothetical protein
MDFLLMSEGWNGEEAAVVRTAADTIGWAFLVWAVGFVLLALLMTMVATRVVRRMAFWCSGVAREVEVEFEDRGLFGFRRREVLTCSAFECPSEITCGRECLRAEGHVRLPFDPPYRIRRA